jgi:Spx/MgsR family transcriptional regulator
MIKVYGIKNCDSVKKAVKYLKEHDIPFTFIDFKTTPVDQTTITGWLEHTDISTLFNTKGTTYRTLGLKELALDEEGKKVWLAKDNLLIKRPIVTLNNQVIVGYNEPLYNNLFQH